MLQLLIKDFSAHPLNIYYSLTDVYTNSVLAIFDSISGGEVETKSIKYNVVHKTGEYQTVYVPGPLSYSPVVLERGYGNTRDLYNWFVLACSGKITGARKNVSISFNAFKDGKYTALVTWNLINAWPTKLSGFQGSQDGAPKVARFSITLTAEKIQRVDA